MALQTITQTVTPANSDNVSTSNVFTYKNNSNKWISSRLQQGTWDSYDYDPNYRTGIAFFDKLSALNSNTVVDSIEMTIVFAPGTGRSGTEKNPKKLFIYGSKLKTKSKPSAYDNTTILDTHLATFSGYPFNGDTKSFTVSSTDYPNLYNYLSNGTNQGALCIYAGTESGEYDVPEEGGKFSSNYLAISSWTINVKYTQKYIISYNKGKDGIGNNDTDIKIHGEDLILSDALFTRTGYTQTGWSILDGGIKVYDFGANYDQNSDITLYPAWGANYYRLTLEPGTGISGITISSSATEDDNGLYPYGSIFAITAYPKAGYKFKNWTGYIVEGEDIDSDENPYKFTMQDSDVLLQANATPNGFIWISVNENETQTWKKAIPYIYNNDEWQQAAPYIYNGSNWKLCGE